MYCEPYHCALMSLFRRLLAVLSLCFPGYAVNVASSLTGNMLLVCKSVRANGPDSRRSSDVRCLAVAHPSR